MDAAAATTAITPADPRRLVLVPVADRSDAVVRRYRLARLKLGSRDATPGSDRFAHLRRAYD